MRIRERLLFLICVTLSTIFTISLLFYPDKVSEFLPIFEARSIAYCPKSAKLGPILSTFATLYSFEKERKIEGFITAKQAQILQYYFKAENLQPYLKILQVHHPKFDEYSWISPFEENYSNDQIWTDVSIGQYLQLNSCENTMEYFVKYLPDIRKIFQIRNTFME